MGEGIVVGAGVRPDNEEAEGGVFDALARGLWGCGEAEGTEDEGGEEDVRDVLGPKV